MRVLTRELSARLAWVSDPGIGRVHDIRATPDGAWLVLTSHGVWRADPSRETAPTRVEGFGAQALADLQCHPDGAEMVGASCDVHITDGVTPLARLDHVDGFSARAVTWSPCGTTVLSGWAKSDSDWYGPGRARVVERTGALRWQIAIDDGWVIAVAWGVDHLAFGTSLGVVHICSLDGDPVRAISLSGLDAIPVAMRFHGDTLTCVSVDDNMEMRIVTWGPDGIEESGIRSVTNSGEVALGAGPLVGYIPMSSTPRDRYRVSIVAPGNPARRTDELQGPLRALGFSLDGSQLAVVDATALHVFATRSGRRRATRSLGVRDSIRGMAISPDSETIATWGDATELVSWSARDGRPVGRLATDARPTSAAFLPGQRVVVASRTGVSITGPNDIRLRDLPSARRLLGVFSDHRVLALGGNDELTGEPQLVLLDTATGASQTWTGGQGAVCGASLSADGRLVMMNTAGGQTLIHDRDSGAVVRTLEIDPRASGAPRWSPLGGWLAWTPKGRGPYRLRLARAATDEGALVDGVRKANILRWSPTGHRLFATRVDARGWLIDPDRAAPIAEVAAGSHVAWSPCGQLIAIARGDTTRSWGIWTDSGQHVVDYQAQSNIVQLAFAPDGTYIAVAARSGDLQIFAAP